MTNSFVSTPVNGTLYCAIIEFDNGDVTYYSAVLYYHNSSSASSVGEVYNLNLSTMIYSATVYVRYSTSTTAWRAVTSLLGSDYSSAVTYYPLS